ncbi:hypothetical protein VDG1235_447 [Verrucomicrobiia bacterium DG1235]|nr:hypothetical protein VDG1235_447 [Verrucomicrobiae bacterium DG1235]
MVEQQLTQVSQFQIHRNELALVPMTEKKMQAIQPASSLFLKRTRCLLW